jgi:preprotein translocase subunit SecG
MQLLILILHVGAALAIIGLVLLQHGKGADAGAAFGSGSAGGVFGASGSANFLSRATGMLAVVFFLTSMSLTYFSVRPADTQGVMRGHQAPANSLPGQVPGPATPAPGSAAPKPGTPAADAGAAGAPAAGAVSAPPPPLTVPGVPAVPAGAGKAGQVPN